MLYKEIIAVCSQIHTKHIKTLCGEIEFVSVESGGILEYIRNAYLLTHSMEQSLSWEANRFAAIQEISRILANRSFITAFTSAVHLALSRVSSIQSIPPHTTSWRFILILSSYLRLDLPNGLFSSGFLTKILYTPLPSHM
jgi:hypothetical protein